MSAALRAAQQALGEGCEIGIRDAATGGLVAVITHPCPGADWFLHRMGQHGRERFKTRKAALAAIGAAL